MQEMPRSSGEKALSIEKKLVRIYYNKKIRGRQAAEYMRIFGSERGIKPKAVGGQAVIEGVMMKGAEDYAIAVRKPDGEIAISKEKLKKNRKVISKIPILRGMYAFIDSMVLGVKGLMYSAEFIEDEDEEEKKKNLPLDEFIKENIIWISVIISVMFSVAIHTASTVIVDISRPYEKQALLTV